MLAISLYAACISASIGCTAPTLESVAKCLFSTSWSEHGRIWSTLVRCPKFFGLTCSPTAANDEGLVSLAQDVDDVSLCFFCTDELVPCSDNFLLSSFCCETSAGEFFFFCVSLVSFLVLFWMCSFILFYESTLSYSISPTSSFTYVAQYRLLRQQCLPWASRFFSRWEKTHLKNSVEVITPPDINKLPPSLFLSSSGSVKKI